MPEPLEDAANWTIRSMPVATRKRALDGALKRGETAAQFMVRAIETQLAVDAGDRIEMPSAQPGPAQPLATPPGLTPEQLHGLADLAREAREGAMAAEVAYPKSAARQTLALLDAAQRAALGKPPRLPRPRLRGPAASIAIEGQVVPGDGHDGGEAPETIAREG